MNEERQYCTFFVSELLFGVEVMEVQEIMSEHHVSAVPLAPTMVAGLVNHRGQIVTAIDMRVRLQLAEEADERPPMMIIARCKDETFGLLVDKIGDVLSVDTKDFEHAPESVQGNARDLVEGAYKLPGCLLLPLSLNKIAEITKQ